MAKTYAEKLKDPRWQKKRLQVLERDGWRCLRCDDDKSTLHVHHKTYKGQTEPWDYSLNNFLTLCENCHTAEQYRDVLEKSFLKNVKAAGFSPDDLVRLGLSIKAGTDLHPDSRFLLKVCLLFRDKALQKKFIKLEKEHDRELIDQAYKEGRI